MNKKELRKFIKSLKKEYSLDEKLKKSLSVWKELEINQFFKDAQNVMLYWSMDDEVATHNFVNKWCKDKNIFLPCVSGDELEIRRFSSMKDMVEGESYKILEPTGEVFTDLQKLDLIIVPGVAFDKVGNRMGRGKGYYDKLLKSVICPKIGVCFDFQLVEKVPTEEFDVPMTEVIVTD